MNPENVQRHDGQSVAAIAASLNEYGQQKPVVVNRENIIIAGNGTLEAALALEWDEIAAVTTDLTAAEAQKAYAIADNKTQEYAEWDYINLKDAFAEIDTGGTNIEATGFSEEEINEIFKYSKAGSEYELPETHIEGKKDEGYRPYLLFYFNLDDDRFTIMEEYFYDENHKNCHNTERLIELWESINPTAD